VVKSVSIRGLSLYPRNPFTRIDRVKANEEVGARV
jgi:hypothetical protein